MLHAYIRPAFLAATFALALPFCAQAEPKHIPSNCFKQVFPKQPIGSAVLGVGVSQNVTGPGKALNEVELKFTHGIGNSVVMSITAIQDFQLLLADTTVNQLVELLAQVRELDRRLVRQGRDFYNEPLLDIPVIDNNGVRQTIVLGVSRVPKWNCFTNGEWAPLSGAAQTLLVLRMPFALEYMRDHDFTGLQFDLEAVTRLSRTLSEVRNVKPATSGTRT